MIFWHWGGLAGPVGNKTAGDLRLQTHLESMSWLSRGTFSRKGQDNPTDTSLTGGTGRREWEELEWVGGQCAGPGLGTAQLEN